MKRLPSLVLVTSVAATALAVAGTPATAGNGSAAVRNRGVGIRLADASVTRRNDPRARIYVDDFVAPGTTFTRHVAVSDFTPKPMHLLVYAAPATIDNENFQIALRGTRSELTDWITVSPSTLDLTPGQTKTVAVTFRVPSTASKGERYGAIVAELPPVAPKPGAVAVATRVGVRVYLAVGPGGEPPSAFIISTLTARRLPDGTPVISARVKNTGGRALDLGGTLSLSDGPGGLRAGPYGVQNLRTLGIGQTGDVDVLLNKQTPRGPWLARLQLQSGYTDREVQGRITFPLHPGTSAAPVKAVPFTRNRHVLVPVAVGLILGLAIGFILFLLWRRRRRDDDEDEGLTDGGPPLVPAQRAARRPRVRQ